jgi:hypothetical protein
MIPWNFMYCGIIWWINVDYIVINVLWDFIERFDEWPIFLSNLVYIYWYFKDVNEIIYFNII